MTPSPHEFLSTLLRSVDTRVRNWVNEETQKDEPFKFEWIVPKKLGVFYPNLEYQGPDAHDPNALERKIKATLHEVRNRIALPEGHPTFEKGGVLVMTEWMERGYKHVM